MEDDVKFVDNFKLWLGRVWDEVLKDFDIVYVGCLVGCSFIGNDGILSYILVGWKGSVWKKVSDYVFIFKFVLGSYCYVVSCVGVFKLLELLVGKVSGYFDF